MSVTAVVERLTDCCLGVDNPRPPPCVRCRRESKRCEFSATRRKRKASEVDESREDALQRDKRMMVGEVVADEPANRTSSYPPPPPTPAPDAPAIETTTTRPTWPDSPPRAPPPPPPSTYPVKAPPAPSTRSFSESRGSRLMYPGAVPGAGAGAGSGSGSGSGSVPAAGSGYGLEGGQPMMNRTAVELLSPAISNSHDALHLLSEAAGRTEDLNRQSRENRYAARQSVSSFNSPMSPMTQAGTPHSAGGSFSRPPRSGAMQVGQYYQASGSESMAAPGAADDRAPPSTSSVPPRDPGVQDAVKAWSRLRFVRAGWLSVEECMAYVAQSVPFPCPCLPAHGVPTNLYRPPAVTTSIWLPSVPSSSRTLPRRPRTVRC